MIITVYMITKLSYRTVVNLSDLMDLQWSVDHQLTTAGIEGLFILFVSLKKELYKILGERNSISIWQINVLYPIPPETIAYNFSIVY